MEERLGGMGTFSARIELANREGTRVREIEALVDTGAFLTMLPTSLLTGLGIVPTKTETFSLADGSTVQMETGGAVIHLNGDHVTTIVVFGPDDAEPLLGAYTLEGLALTVDPRNSQLIKAKLTL